MNEYKTAGDLRRALEARVKIDAENTGIDYMRLRRTVIFDRIAARLSVAEQGWVLKGGAALEFRLGLRARATKDLDLVLRSEPSDGATVRDVLIETLTSDVDRDSFVFTVGHPTELAPDAAGNPGWRFRVDGALAGKTFIAVKIDIVLRPGRARRDGTHLASRQARIRGNPAANHRVRPSPPALRGKAARAHARLRHAAQYAGKGPRRPAPAHLRRAVLRSRSARRRSACLHGPGNTPGAQHPRSATCVAG